MAKETSRWVFGLLARIWSGCDISFLTASLLAAVVTVVLIVWRAAATPGGPAWVSHYRRCHKAGQTVIPGPSGLPVLGSLLALSSPDALPHRILAAYASSIPGARRLMAFSIGSTRAVVTCDPAVAREILSHPGFADRPLKHSARLLMFRRAIGFAPSGAYWRLLRGFAASHLFSPRCIAAQAPGRSADCTSMLFAIAAEQASEGQVHLRRHLQGAALNNVMGSVFGCRYDVRWYESGVETTEVTELRSMVREGFELLGSFNWSDHLPWMGNLYDPERIGQRCSALVPRVRRFVKAIIDNHRARAAEDQAGHLSGTSDFVDMLLSLEGDSKLDEEDMIAILWEMIFRGTDTIALLAEWTMAELVANHPVQKVLRSELDPLTDPLTDPILARLPYLQAVIKETLRVHPPGPLLSWARLATADVPLTSAGGLVVPRGTTAMINMWAIAHDPAIWPDPEKFRPERFLGASADIDVRGADLKLAPFGAGRRVCPGKDLGLATVTLWVASLVKDFEWSVAGNRPVDFTEVLKLSCEMKKSLVAIAVPSRQ